MPRILSPQSFELSPASPLSYGAVPRSTSTFNCPHAALISRPRLRRTTASTPWFFSRAAKARILSGGVGMRPGAPPMQRKQVDQRAHLPGQTNQLVRTRSLSFFRDQTYSGDPLPERLCRHEHLPGRTFPHWHQARRRSGSRVQEMASRNCSWLAASPACSMIPTVETVIWRAPMPAPGWLRW